MSSQSGDSTTARKRGRWLPVAWWLGVAVCGSGCKPEPKPAVEAPREVTIPVEIKNALLGQLADARIDQAKAKLDQKLPGEALALLLSALKADPASTEARDRAQSILAETAWNIPTLTIQHKLPIEQIGYVGSGSLWVSLGGETITTVRWNLETLEIESVLFPVAGRSTRSMVFGPLEKSVVIERGPVTLLCDAQTIKPVCDLGPMPEDLMPASTIAFSPDGLLLAQPGFVSEKDHSLVWKLRDATTGQIIRSSDPAPAAAPRPITAYLDRQKLRVLHTDGSLFEMPVSPVEAVQSIPIPEPVKLLYAQFSQDGNSVLTLQEQGPHEPPLLSVISYQDPGDGSLELEPLMDRFPWSRQPNIWNGLIADPATAPFAIEGKTLRILTATHSPVETASEITAAAFHGPDLLTGGSDGTLTFHRILPLPTTVDAETAVESISPDQLAAFQNLCETLTGGSYDEKAREFVRVDTQGRFKAFGDCDLESIHHVFPALDFEPVAEELHNIHERTAEPVSFLPLWDRLARADLTGLSWTSILTLAGDLADSRWHRQLTHATRREPVDSTNPEKSPWIEGHKMEAIFRSGDSDAILTSIREAGDQGPAAASALALALESEHPEWIRACLENAKDLPPVLRQIAGSRVAWLEGQRATALSPWPDEFPQMREILERQDWEGWELADFEPALENIRKCVQEELVAIEVPESSTAEQRKAIAERLADPETIATVGKPRFGIACMKAALAFSAHKEESETTFELANTARNLGAPPEPCLRAEALALTAMGDYEKAHPRWIELITEHPLETQIPGDYAEAAYTAFENADPQQAMTILTTGMHRYPQDANFSLRAGWVALLTGNPERGYQFLQAGKRIGFPKEKAENAIALLTIAAAQSGDYDDATVYFNDLVKIDPAWAELKTLDTLDWPDELKSVLGQFMH
jgi:tetratricopeptide (TPR) repeat protein